MASFDLAKFCINYSETLQSWGKLFVFGAFAAVVALTVLQALAALRTSGDTPRARGSAFGEILQAVTPLIDALIKAPTWLAMLVAGMAMMWMSVNALPVKCSASSIGAAT